MEPSIGSGTDPRTYYTTAKQDGTRKSRSWVDNGQDARGGDDGVVEGAFYGSGPPTDVPSSRGDIRSRKSLPTPPPYGDNSSRPLMQSRAGEHAHERPNGRYATPLLDLSSFLPLTVGRHPQATTQHLDANAAFVANALAQLSHSQSPSARATVATPPQDTLSLPLVSHQYPYRHTGSSAPWSNIPDLHGLYNSPYGLQSPQSQGYVPQLYPQPSVQGDAPRLPPARAMSDAAASGSYSGSQHPPLPVRDSRVQSASKRVRYGETSLMRSVLRHLWLSFTDFVPRVLGRCGERFLPPVYVSSPTSRAGLELQHAPFDTTCGPTCNHG
jgi:hypothetical protein